MSRRDNVNRMKKARLTLEVPIQKENLPPGVCFLESPLFHFHINPWNYLLHVTRYFHLAEKLMTAITAKKSPTEEGTPIRVMDIGCGYGEMHRFLNTYRRPRGYRLEYVGIDGDPTALELGKQIAPSANLNLGNIPQDLGKYVGYDGFCCSEVLEHISSEDGKKLFEWMGEAANPGAVAAFTVPTPELSKHKDFDFHLHEYRVEEMLQLIKDNGWKLITWYWLRVPVNKIPNRNKEIPNIVFSAANSPSAPKDFDLKSGIDAFYLFEKE